MYSQQYPPQQPAGPSPYPQPYPYPPQQPEGARSYPQQYAYPPSQPYPGSAPWYNPYPPQPGNAAPYPYQGSYAPPPQPNAVPAVPPQYPPVPSANVPRMNPRANRAMINGIISLALSLLTLATLVGYAGIITGTFAIIYGFIGLNKAKQLPNQMGRNQAIVGIVLGAVGWLIVLLSLIIRSAHGISG